MRDRFGRKLRKGDLAVVGSYRRPLLIAMVIGKDKSMKLLHVAPVALSETSHAYFISPNKTIKLDEETLYLARAAIGHDTSPREPVFQSRLDSNLKDGSSWQREP